MARTKRPPVQREPSTEYTSKLDRTPTRPATQNGNGESLSGKTNGHATAVAQKQGTAPAAKKEGSFVTLVIDIAGIYASL